MIKKKKDFLIDKNNFILRYGIIAISMAANRRSCVQTARYSVR